MIVIKNKENIKTVFENEKFKDVVEMLGRGKKPINFTLMYETLQRSPLLYSVPV